jgi:hypothetical protein
MRQRNGPRQGVMRLEGRTRRRVNVLDHGLAVVTVPVAFGPVLACRYGHP